MARSSDHRSVRDLQITRLRTCVTTISATMTTAKIATRITRDAVPLEEVQRGVERHADAAGADQAEHRRLAHVDVPAKQRDRPERRPHLRPVAERQRATATARRPRSSASIGPRLRLLERFAEQLADEADRAERDRQRAGERAGPEDADEEQRPDQRIDRARRHEDQLREQVERRRAARGCARRGCRPAAPCTSASSVPSDAMWIVSISAACTPSG